MSKSGIAPEILTLPDGGGSISPIGERFEPDIFTGTGQFRVPLWFPKGVRGWAPEIALVYATTLGAGPFGFGWRLDSLAIRRATDRGTPRFANDDPLDLSTDRLVAVAGGEYRLAARPEHVRVTRVGEGFQVRDGEGNTFVLGDSAASRQTVTVDGASSTLAWLVSTATDPFGNVITYEYDHDGGQAYLTTISYAAYDVRLRYEARPDPLVDARAGAPMHTARRCHRIEYRPAADPTDLLRAYDFAYEQAGAAGHSLLTGMTLTGHDADGNAASMPPLSLSYTPFEPDRARLRRMTTHGASAPPSLASPDLTLVDLFARGLPDIVQLGLGAGRYWENLGRGRFAPARTVRGVPASATLEGPAVAFADMDGTGTADLVDVERGVVYTNQAGHGWTGTLPLRAATPPLGDPRLRLLDLDGDHVTDALLTGGRFFFLFLNAPPDGWRAPVRVSRVSDLAVWPDVSFDDPRVKLADMTGDGLTDIVWVHAGRLDYWPYHGNGRWGARVRLDLEPGLGREFDPRRLLLTDLDGDGAADVVYARDGELRFWINRAGRTLAPQTIIRHTPRLAGAEVVPADMTGAGEAGLLWSRSPSRLDRASLLYLDVTDGRKPYLLSSINNGMGLVTEIDYRSSVDHLVDDRDRRVSWATSLPFPVVTVAAVTQRDTVTGVEQRRSYRYHDGYFDGMARDFRGFGRVEALEAGDASVPPGRTVSFFHQGAGPAATPLQRASERALAGRLHRVEVYADDGSPLAGVPHRVDESEWDVRQVATGVDGTPVVVGRLRRAITRHTERVAGERRGETLYEYDGDNRIARKEEVFLNEDASEERLVTQIAYAVDPVGVLRGRPSEVRLQTAAGNLVSLRRFYYDGPAKQGLPLGQVSRGLVSRQEDLVLDPAVASAAYGADPPDFAALGYHAMPLPAGGDGWGINSATRGYDAAGRLVTLGDAGGHPTTLVYDATGLFVREVRGPLGHTFTIEHDPRGGGVSSLTDPNGTETTYGYDGLGRLRFMVKPGDTDALPTLALSYVGDAVPTSVRTETRLRSGEAETAASLRYFDGFGRTRQQRTEAEDGQVVVETETARNRRGLVATTVRPFFSTGLDYVDEHGPEAVTSAYDGLGRLIATELPDGTSTRIEHGLYSVVRYDATDTDDSPANVARGHFDTPKTERLAASGRILSVTERSESGADVTTRYAYDPAGRLQQITDARGELTATYVHDLLGRKLRVTHADAGDRVIAYTAAGNLAESREPRGSEVAYGYDALNRMETIAVDGTVVERHTYDTGTGANLALRLARVEDEAGVVELSYDARGLLAAKHRTVTLAGGPQTFTLAYAYDAREQLSRVTYPDGASVDYGHSPRGLVTRVDGFVDRLAYNALGQTTAIELVNGVVTEHEYGDTNSLLQRSRVLHTTTGATYSDQRFTYDAIGNPLTIADHATAAGHARFDRTFAYDARHQLTAASGDAAGTPFVHSYAYDDVGNATRNDEFGAGTLTLAPGGGNRIQALEQGGVVTPLFEYDAAGHLSELPGMTLTFDARSRLVRADRADGAVLAYAYGHDGERVLRRVTKGGVTRESVFLDGLWEWHDGQATRHVMGAGRRYAVQAGGVVRFLHADNLGSAIVVTAADGALLFQSGYFAFGSTAFRQAADTDAVRFAQQYLDEELGLYYFGARYFHPGLGRFISPDPAVLSSPDVFLTVPLALNPYAYALNNPVRLVDVNGNWWQWIVGGLIIIALVVLTVVTYGGASPLWAAGAAYFPYFAAAATGAIIGGAVGITHAAAAGESLADGFLFGVLIGAAAGATGYWAGITVAGAVSGPWGLILGQGVQGAIVGFGDGLIQGLAANQGFLEVLRSAAIGAVIGFAAAAAVQRAGQLATGLEDGWFKSVTTMLMYTGDPASDACWWGYVSYTLRPLPKRWAFEKVGNWLTPEDTATSSSGLTSHHDSLIAGISPPHAYETRSPLSAPGFGVAMDEFLQGALSTLLTGGRRDVESAIA